MLVKGIVAQLLLRCTLLCCMSSFSCRWVYMSLASLALRTALLHVVPQLPLALGVACPWTLLTFAGCASAAAGSRSMCRLPVWRRALLGCMLYLRCRWFYVSFAHVALCAARLHVVLALPPVCRWFYVLLSRGPRMRCALLGVCGPPPYQPIYQGMG